MTAIPRSCPVPDAADLEQRLRILLVKGAGTQERRREALRRFESDLATYIPAVCRLADHESRDVSEGAVWLLEKFFSTRRDLSIEVLALRSFPARCAQLAKLAVRLTQNLADGLDSAQHLSESEKAEALNNLSERLAESGRLGEALQRAQEAVDLFKRIAVSKRDAGLVLGTMTLAKRHAALGQREPALLAAADAATLAAELPSDSEPAKELVVGMALTCLSNRLLTAGHGEEAVEAASLAMEGLQRFRATGADLRDHLGMAALARANAMLRLGRHRDTIPIAQMALDELRGPAADKPGEFWECLLAAANALATALAETGNAKEAHRIISEHLRGFDALADRYPLIYGSDYVAYLVAYSGYLGDAGERRLALKYAIQAVDRVRRIRSRGRSEDINQLGVRALNNLFNRYYEAGSLEEALRVAKEAVQWTRKTSCQDSGFAEDRIRSLRNLAEALRVSDAASQGTLSASRIAKQAVRAALDQKENSNPNFRLLVGHCLSTLSLCCLETGDIDGAVHWGQESAEVRRQLFQKDPVSFRRELAFALRLLAECHLQGGHLLQCLRFIAEALRHYGLCSVETQEDLRQLEADAFRIRTEALVKLDRPSAANRSIRRALDLLIDLYPGFPDAIAIPLFGLIPKYLQIRTSLGLDIEPDVIAVVEAHKTRTLHQPSTATSSSEVPAGD